MNIAQAVKVMQSSVKANFPLLVKGPPGIGKSDIALEASTLEKMPLIIRHPVIEESVDYKGLPGFENGQAKFFPFADFHEMLCAPIPTVVLFEDLGQAPSSVQASLMQVVLAREIGGKKISKEVRFLAATNSRKDNAGVSNLITPLVSRFTVIEIEADAISWVKWALKNAMPIELISFLRFKPANISTFDPAKQKDITPFACPRSIAQLGKWINAGCLDFDVWNGAVGTVFATEFKAFYDTYKALAGLPDKVIQNPQTAPIPDRPDVMYALAGALAHRANDVSFPSMVAYGERLSQAGFAEMETALVTDCTGRHPALLETRAYVEYATRNAENIG